MGAQAASCWEDIGADASDANRTVRVSLPPHLHARTDAALLDVILRNLFSNAVAYTPAGGEIAVSLDALPADGFRLTVTNRVEGLTAADTERLFERFWRRDVSRTDSTHHGLGLSLARLCAEVTGYRLSAGLDAAANTLSLTLEPASPLAPA